MGPPKIEIGGVSLAESLPNKAQAILYYLVTTGQAWSRPALATLLWGDMPEESARANLRRALVDLRPLLGNYLEIDRHTVAIRATSEVWVDVVEFEAALSRPRSGPALMPPEVERLQAAVDLYRGDFLQGFSVLHAPDFEAWLATQQARFRETVMQALRTLADHYTAADEPGQGIAVSRRLLHLEPWREEAHRQLMLLLAGDGQRSAALAQYETCRQALAEALGVEPGRETTALYERIRDEKLSRGAALRQAQEPGQGGKGAGEQGSGGEVFSPAPLPLRSLTFRHNLPEQPTPFIGREQELADIIRRLTDRNCRLLTLVGPGGMGKTRLALQTAQTFIEAQAGVGLFEQGVLFVPLADVSTTAGVVSAIAGAANFSFYGEIPPHQQLLDHLREKEMLLVLDTFEHLLAPTAGETTGPADLIAAILAAAPQVKILVTSRKALNLQIAWFHPLEGMSFPPALPSSPLEGGEDQANRLTGLENYDAVRLFVQSAARARVAFSLAAERAAVVRICRLVEGMPLAIELAAAWLKVLPVETVAAEIERGLDILTTRHHNIPARHRSMRVVLEQAWHWLTQAEQTVFKRLSVFRGGFAPEAARVVAGATLPDLAALVDKSMLTVTATGRYHLHELLRQYATEQLAESPPDVTKARDKHCVYYADFLEQRLAGLLGGRQRLNLAEIAAEDDNVWAAWRWALKNGKILEMEKSISSLQSFCQFRGRYLEGATAWEAAVDYLSALEPTELVNLTLIKALMWCSWLLIRLGQLDKAEAMLTRCRDLYQQLGLPPVPGYGTDPALALSLIATIRGDYDLAVQYGEQARRESEAHDHAHNLCEAHYVLACATLAQSDYQAAQQHAQRALALARQVDDRWFVAYCLNELGKSTLALGDVAAAQQHFETSYALRQEFDDPGGMAVALNHLGEIALHQQDYERAGQLYQESLALYQNIADKGGLATTYQGLGLVASKQGDFQAARQHLHRALQLAAEIHYVPLTFSILNVSGEMLLETGQAEPGLMVLTFVREHAPSHQSAQAEAQQRLNEYEAQLQQELNDRLPQDSQRTLTEVIQEVLKKIEES